jgi:hypothetical protein
VRPRLRLLNILRRMFAKPVRRDDVSSCMRIIGHREVAPYVYEVVIESDRYGRVTRRVLVLPSSVLESA